MLASEYGGYVRAVAVEEGEAVRAGDVIVQLDTTLIDAQIEAAEAGVDLARAGLAKAKAGARQGQVAIAEAQLAQAKAAYLAATQAVSDTAMLVARPQDIQLEINVLSAQLDAADRKLSSALALKDAAKAGKDRFEEAQRAIREAGGPGRRRFRAKVAEGTFDQLLDRIPEEVRDQLPDTLADGLYTFQDIEIEVSGGRYILYRWVTVNLNLPFEAHLAPNAWWQAWVGVNATAAERDGLVAMLNQLYARRANPQQLLAQADEAIALQSRAAAQVALAAAQLAGLRAGATQEQIAAIGAQVAQAETLLASLLSKRARMVIVSPIDGVVVSVSTHEGEIAAKGATLATVADLSTVQLTVYLPETQIGAVYLGQDVQVAVDSFGDRVFGGSISHIADSAEFTPRSIATKEERVNLVFAIEISLANPDDALKPGMPADAVFGARDPSSRTQ
jgi:multidrug resistance efflux pump